MIGNPALAHLLDMGIPGGRARAALRRTRGDVVSAAVSISYRLSFCRVEKAFGKNYVELNSRHRTMSSVEKSTISLRRTKAEITRTADQDQNSLLTAAVYALILTHTSSSDATALSDS